MDGNDGTLMCSKCHYRKFNVAQLCGSCSYLNLPSETICVGCGAMMVDAIQQNRLMEDTNDGRDEENPNVDKEKRCSQSTRTYSRKF